MAFADKKGIVVASPFKLQAESLLDVRQQVDTITERNELVTIKAATAGLRVYVKETKKSYVYNGTSWDELSVGNASLIVKLNGGTSEGTNMFTYNGTTNKTINITAAGIGAAGKTHTHTKSEITDFPTSLKNPQALKFTGAATASYDGSAAVTVTIPTTSKTTKSLIVTLNGGTTEGTNKFTFNGSAEKTINITPSTIGAAAATHTHDKSQITGLTAGRVLISDTNGHPAVSAVTSTELGYIDGVTSNIQTQLNGKAASTHTHNYAGSSSAGGSANSAVKLATARKINGTSFDGTKDINIQNNYFESVSEQNLNSFRTYGEYYGAGGNNCTNRPSGVDSFYLKIFRNASGYTAQSLYSVGVWYSRYYDGSSWSTWSKQYSSTSKPTASEIGAASSSHTHTKSQITDFPTSLKNPNALTFAGAVTGTYDGSKAVTINIPTTGATTKSSLTIQLNGGTTEGTNKFTFNGGTAKTINITPASIGAAAASHGTHVTYGTSAPKANGTASAGSATSVSRSDHVHPLQTTVSGNAGSATKLATARTIDGVSFNGTANITHYGTCSTAASTAAKVVSCTGFALATGAKITVKFTVTNTASNPTLNVNNTGAKAIQYRGSAISSGYLAANRVYTFIYDGTNYQLIGDINTDTNTTYGTGTATTAGLTRLYTSTGSATNGTMTQKAITDALAGKSSSSHTHNYAGSSSVGGAANSAVKLTTARTINGTSFDGTKNITLNAMYAEDLSNKNVSLNTYNLSSGTPKVKYYFCPTDGNGDGITGRPDDAKKNAFFLICESVRFASATDYITKQTYIHGATKITWERYCTNGTWSAWGERYTSQNKPTASEIGAASSSHTHNYAGSSSAGGAANSANRLNGISLTGGSGATTGYRLIATVKINAWGNYRGVFAVNSRHTGAGLLCISVGCNNSPVSFANGYSEIMYFGPVSSGSIISSDSFLVHMSSDGTKAYIFWKFSDYNTTTIVTLDSDFAISNGTWMTSISTSTYGKRKATTTINPSSAHNHSADNITSGTLPVARGGTGATTALAANYNILKDTPSITDGWSDDTYIAFISSTPNTTQGALRKYKAGNVWSHWLNSKISASYAAKSHTHNYAGSSSAGGAANSANKVPVPVGTVLFATSSTTTFFNACFGGTWEIVGNIDAIYGSSKLTLYMFRKTAA